MQMHCYLFLSTLDKPSRVHSLLKQPLPVRLIRHHWSETGASLSTHAMFTVEEVYIFDIFVEPIMLLVISRQPTGYRELLLTDVANILWKRSVGSQWWSVRPHGHYHHGSDHRTHD